MILVVYDMKTVTLKNSFTASSISKDAITDFVLRLECVSLGFSREEYYRFWSSLCTYRLVWLVTIFAQMRL